MDIPISPSSSTLQPPRKSIELEDPGAHDLGIAASFIYLLQSPKENTDAVYRDIRK